MNTVKVRGVVIGEGIPKIIVPIVGVTEKEILKQAESFYSIPLDVVEWRADWFESVSDQERVLEVLKKLRSILGDTPLLMTFRTAKEGGEKDISPEAYADLNCAAARSGLVDLIDVELFTGEDIVKEIIEKAHAANVKVVASSHDFQKTPPKEELLRRMLKMQELGADIPKIAVMPQSKRDVLTLLSATEEMVTVHADRPIITMSMAGTGVVSRLCGETFGSSMTFGAAGKASAPGQMDVQDLNTVLNLIHQSL